MANSYRYFKPTLVFGTICFIFLASTLPFSGLQAQIKTIYHRPQATLGMPELLRVFKPEFSTFSIQLHPGWLQKEEYDSLHHISVLSGLDPTDTNHLFIKVISQRFASKSIDKNNWALLKANLRTNYGNRKIGTVELSDTVFTPKSDNNILARYELLAKMTDSYEYSATIITTTETLLLIAPLPATDDITSRLNYFREITANISETAK